MLRPPLIVALFAAVVLIAPTRAQEQPTVATTTARANQQRTIVGTAIDLIPTGTPGVVSVVSVGDYSPNDGLPVVVRNDRDRTFYDLEVSAAVYDSTGWLIASGDDLLGFAPEVMRPGEMAIGYLWFDGVALPDDATFDFTLQATMLTVSSDPIYVAFGAIEASAVGDRLVGSVTNTSTRTVTGASARIMCLTENGTPLSVRTVDLNPDMLTTDQEATFQMILYGEPCPRYLVAAGGIGD